MTRQHLVLFARAPEFGRGKRRLARDIGDLAAVRFERAMLRALYRRLGRDRRWRLHLSVTPRRACRRARLWPRNVPVAPQADGDLGIRMWRTLAACPPGPALLIGADIPGLAAGHIADAFRALGRHDLVFGPARDGGFWLIGARRPAILPAVFAAVGWSGPQALADVLANVPRRLSVGFAACLDDVDDGPAFRRLCWGQERTGAVSAKSRKNLRAESGQVRHPRAIPGSGPGRGPGPAAVRLPPGQARRRLWIPRGNDE